MLNLLRVHICEHDINSVFQSFHQPRQASDGLSGGWVDDEEHRGEQNELFSLLLHRLEADLVHQHRLRTGGKKRAEGIRSDRTVVKRHARDCTSGYGAGVVYLGERVRGVVPLEKAYVGVIVDIEGKECGKVRWGSAGTVRLISQASQRVLQPLLCVV